jgi:HK97 family phage portal protein
MGFRAALQRAAQDFLAPIMANTGGGWPFVREPYTGAWQRNDENWTTDSVLAHSVVYRCVNLIANDIGKLRLRLVQKDGNGIWTEAEMPAYARVLRKPNNYQTWVQFREAWIMSKLLRGNTYVYIDWDGRDVPRALHILDASRVKPLIAPDGEIFYELKDDNLAGLRDEQQIVPADSIIHDRINCLYHPLIGTSPIFAAGLSAHMGLTIENNSAGFFRNGMRMVVQLMVPGNISPEQAKEMSARFRSEFGGPNGKQIAVMTGGMKLEPVQMTAVDAQLIDHLRWSAENVCTAFGVPAWKVGVGEQPAYTKPEIANQQYYSDCLQSHIEQMEAVLDAAFGFTEPSTNGVQYGMELMVEEGLLRMDFGAQIATLVAASGGAIMTPNEARLRADLPPTPGGDALYKQQQDHSLEALAERDANDPFAKPAPAPALPPPQQNQDEEAEAERARRAFHIRARTRTFRMRTAA